MPDLNDELLKSLAQLSTGEQVFLAALGGLFVLVYAYTVWIVLSGAVGWFRRRKRPGHGETWPVYPRRRWGRRRAAGDSPRRSRFWRGLRGATLTLAVLGGLCALDAWFIEPYWAEVAHYEVYTDKLPASPKAIRVVHITDTHCEEHSRLEDDLPALIRRENPDLIVWTGDAANDFDGLWRFKRLMTQLAQIAPTYGVRGNWDSGTPALLVGTGVTEVDGLPIDVTIRGARICVTGGAWNQQRHTLRSLERADPTRYIMFLNHAPDMLLHAEEAVMRDENPVAKPDIFFAGHTHGGQIRLPFYGALATRQKTDKLFADGVVDYNGTMVHVGRGIGMVGTMPRVRFFCRPEIAVIDIIGTGK